MSMRVVTCPKCERTFTEDFLLEHLAKHCEGKKSPVEMRQPRTPSNVLPQAEALFDDLLRARQLLSYKAAYPRLLEQEAPDLWYQNHAEPVVQAAESTKPRRVANLWIQLDALIVLRKGEVPGEGHFARKQYTYDQWMQVFGSWPLRE